MDVPCIKSPRLSISLTPHLLVSRSVNLEREEVPIDDASDSMTPSYNVSVAINDKVKELIRAVALPVLLAPLHVQTRVKFDNSDVLVVVRALARPNCARHHETSIHRISSNPGSLGHPLDVYVLCIFEIAFQIKGPK